MSTFSVFKTRCLLGIPWQSSGYHSVLSLLRAWVQFLVRELRSNKVPGVAKQQQQQQQQLDVC